MKARVEELIAAAATAEIAAPAAAEGVYARLQFLAKVLRNAPETNGGRGMLLWYDAEKQVAVASIGNKGVVIGRAPDCDIVLVSPRLSRRHAVVRPTATGPGAEIEDLGSSNGTLVKGRAIPAYTTYLLHDGDLIEVGGVVLAVVLDGGMV